MKLLFILLFVSLFVFADAITLTMKNIDGLIKDMNFKSAKEFVDSTKTNPKGIPPCKGHSQFEGSFYKVFSKSGALVTGLAVSYDADNKRVRELEEITVAGQKYLINNLVLFNKKIQYMVDMKTHTCTNKTIDEPWVPLDIPFDATYIGSAYLAGNATSQGLLLDFYNGKKQLWDFWEGVTREGCWPAYGGFTRSDIGYVDVKFYNLTPGIKDPSVFDVPKECQTFEEN